MYRLGDRPARQRTAVRTRRYVTTHTGAQVRARTARQYPGFYSSRPKIVYYSPAQRHAMWKAHRDAVVAQHKRSHAAWRARRDATVARHKATRTGGPNVFTGRIGSDTLQRRLGRVVQHTDVLRARQPGYPRLPAFPTFNRPYTKRERDTINRETLRVARKQGVTGKNFSHVLRSRPQRAKAIRRAAHQANEAYQAQEYRRLVAAHTIGATTGQVLAGKHMLTKAQRESLRQIEPVLKELRSGKSIPISAQAAAARHYHEVHDPPRQFANPGPKKSAIDKFTGNLADELSRRWQPAGFLRAPFETGRALIEHPSAIPKTLKDLALLPVAAPAGVVHAALHPKKTVQQTIADLNRRYGSLDPTHSNAGEFRERIRKEGAAPELLDFAGVASAEGAVLGRSLGHLARKGSFGAKAARFAAEPRPHLRITGGVARSQELSPNLFRAGLQRTEDRLRTRRVERRAGRAGEHGARGMQPQTHVRPAVEGRYRQFLPGPNAEVVPLFEKRAQRIAVSKIATRHFQRYTGETQREVSSGALRELSKLSGPQRQAVFHVLQGLVPAHSPREAVAHLKARRAAIVRAYRATGRKGLPREVKTIDYLIKHADEVFGAKLQRFHEAELARAERVGHTGVRDTTAEARRFRPQAHHLGIAYEPDVMEREIRQQAERELRSAKTKEEAHLAMAARDQALRDLADARPELDRQFVEKVRAAARAKGLPDPVYLQHFSLLSQAEGRAAKAIGGRRAAPKPKRSRLEEGLFAQGRADVRPAAYVQSLYGAIKRKHNWASVAAQAEAHSFPVPSRAELHEVFGHQHVDPERLSAYEWRQVLEHRGLDSRDYMLWNPGRFRKKLADPITGQAHEARDALSDREVEHALDEGFVRVDGADETVPGQGFRLIPREVYDEIHSGTTGSGFGSRLVDRAQALQSRLLLGTNPGWLQIQTAANAFLAGFGTRGNVADFVRAPVFFHRLPKEVRQEVDELFGTGVGSGHGRRVHLGSTADGGLVNGYRALREALGFKAATFRQAVPVLRSLPSGNPIELMFAMDNFQNRYFKRVVLYNHLKRQAFRDMSREGGVAYRLQQQITHLMSLGPKERMRAMVENPQLLERHAEAVDNILGDYTRYTAKERATLKRYVLFYGFMRYSLRTLFYTMPVKHPVVMSAIGKLAQLHVQEVRDLLGGDEAPWAYSRVFIGPKGNLRSIDFARLNPVANPFIGVSTEGLKSVGGFLSPVAQAALDQIYGENLYTGRGFRIHGSAEEARSIDPATRARIFAGDILGTIYPYRLAQQATQRGTQGDEALLGLPAPIHFKTPAAQERERQRRKREGSVGQELLHQAVPLLYRPDDSRAAAAAIREARRKRSQRGRGRGTGSPFPAAPSGSGSPFPG